MRLGVKVTEARWDESLSKWVVRLQNINTGAEFTDVSDVIYRGVGGLNQWKWPDIAGLHSFQGKLIHSANWDLSYDYKGKKVAVIGAGSSGIQIVPSIQPNVRRLDHYIRGRTWISTPFVADEVRARGAEISNFDYTKEEQELWSKNPELYLEYRKRLEHELQGVHSVTHKESELAKGAKTEFTELMRKRLKKKSYIAEHLIPEFSPGCRRLTPGPGYLEALTEDNVDVIPTSIEEINAYGIKTADGKQRDVDLIVCATGFDTTNRNGLPIYGINGVKLQDRWHDYPETYMTMAVDKFPNMFMSLGPNSAVGSGNLLILIESFAEYIAKALAKMQTENIRTMQPTKTAVQSFSKFCDAYFANTVFSEECNSWYKGGKSKGRVSALWPGSSLHAIQAMRHPRWEDWEYTYVDGNSWGWFGDGFSAMDSDPALDRTFYLTQNPKMIHEPLVKEAIAKINGIMPDSGEANGLHAVTEA
jgi:cation diffusion facilitator CzcD-associated flavoprotein CzcO